MSTEELITMPEDPNFYLIKECGKVALYQNSILKELYALKFDSQLKPIVFDSDRLKHFQEVFKKEDSI